MREPTLEPSRRQIIARAAMAVGGLVGMASALGESRVFPQEADAKHVTHLHQEIVIAASHHKVYEAIMDEKQFAALTKLSAKIERTEGGAFATFGGIIIGRNIELVQDKMIVQAWKPKYWDPGVFSLVKFELVPVDGNTKVVLDHTGFPAGDYESLNSGWAPRYWDPIKKFLA